MEILYVLIPISLLAAMGIGWAFVWAFRSDQFEDLEGPAWRVVMDDDGIADDELVDRVEGGSRGPAVRGRKGTRHSVRIAAPRSQSPREQPM